MTARKTKQKEGGENRGTKGSKSNGLACASALLENSFLCREEEHRVGAEFIYFIINCASYVNNAHSTCIHRMEKSGKNELGE